MTEYYHASAHRLNTAIPLQPLDEYEKLVQTREGHWYKGFTKDQPLVGINDDKLFQKAYDEWKQSTVNYQAIQNTFTATAQKKAGNQSDNTQSQPVDGGSEWDKHHPK